MTATLAQARPYYEDPANWSVSASGTLCCRSETNPTKKPYDMVNADGRDIHSCPSFQRPCKHRRALAKLGGREGVIALLDYPDAASCAVCLYAAGRPASEIILSLRLWCPSVTEAAVRAWVEGGENR